MKKAILPLDAVGEPTGANGIVDVADGIRLVRLRLPFKLDHVNCWIMDDHESWTVIDCGAATTETAAVWAEVAATMLRPRCVTRLIATHGHTDHVGYAGTFVSEHGCSFVMTQAEWQACRLRHFEAWSDPSGEAGHFFEQHGLGPHDRSRFEDDRQRTRTYLGLPPGSFQRIRRGDRIRIGADEWEVLTHGGHSPEHASLYCAARGILIAGDQVLPSITPVIGVFSGEPLADPLGEYLDSLEELSSLPVDTLVLPSHGSPYRGIRDRIEQIRIHHGERLDRLREIAHVPVTAFEAAWKLFPKAIAQAHGRLAFAETLAHLNYLAGRGQAAVEETAGRWHFRTR